FTGNQREYISGKSGTPQMEQKKSKVTPPDTTKEFKVASIEVGIGATYHYRLGLSNEAVHDGGKPARWCLGIDINEGNDVSRGHLAPLRGSGRVSQDGGFLGLAGLWGCRNGEFSRQTTVFWRMQAEVMLL
ncbi:MAG: hypothetical protein R6V12_19420, partial [Candidatus Hydrogenedentota bacterium]